MSDQQITAALLREIQSRVDRATAGPWKSFVEGRDHTSGSSFIRTGGDDIELSGATDEDQDFIASSRQDIPLLLAEIYRLREAVK
ncbi:hypothetical protein [Roseateles sp. P5_E7]